MIRFIFGILLGILIIIFAAQNTEIVQYTFLVWTLTAPRALVVIGVFLLGLVSGWLATGMRVLLRRSH